MGKVKTALRYALRGDFASLFHGLRNTIARRRGSSGSQSVDDIRNSVLQIESFLHLKLDKFDAQWSRDVYLADILERAVARALTNQNLASSANVRDYSSTNFLDQADRFLQQQQKTLAFLENTVASGSTDARALTDMSQLLQEQKTLLLNTLRLLEHKSPKIQEL